MRLSRTLTGLATSVAVAGCGGAGGSDGVDDTLGYVPADAPVVALLSTDLDSDQYRQLDERLEALGSPAGVEEALRLAVEEEEEGEGADPLSYEQDVKPLLGEDLVLAVTDRETLAGEEEGYLAAIEVGDPEKLAELLQSPYFELRRGEEVEGADLYLPRGSDGEDGAVAIDGSTLVAAQQEETVRDALERQSSGEGYEAQTFADSLSGLPDDAPLRVAATPAGALYSLPVSATDIPWVGALRSFGATLSVDEDTVAVDASAKTDAGELSDEDLPVTTEEQELGLPAGEGRLVSASANQSVSTRWLLRAVGTLFPTSQFEARRKQIEDDLDLRLDRVLALFDGPSVSAQAPDAGIATRSEVSDPEALAAALEKLAPRLPELAEALGPIGDRTVLGAIRTVAPKLPLPGEGLTRADVETEPLPGEPNLYRLEASRPPGPGEPAEAVVFGMIGDFFVVAEDLDSARAIARAETEPAEDLSGGTVFRADREYLSAFLTVAGGEELSGFDDVRGWLRASTEELRAHAELAP